jgi:TrmH RNA methyltransferase
MSNEKWKRGAPAAPSPWKSKLDRSLARDSRGERPAPRADRSNAEAPRTPATERFEPRTARPLLREQADDRRPPRAPSARRESFASSAETRDEPRPQRPSGEIRLYGINACTAAFARRPEDLRKVYLTEARIPALKSVLAWCVQNRLGYRVVEEADLDKLTGSRHHEGVCFEMRRVPALSLQALLAANPSAPAASLLIWLDGVGNPHNLGALLRSAAHFGVGGVIVPTSSSLDLSGAAARVAEGGAEAVALARVDDERAALKSLREAGYSIAATVPRDGTALYAAELPQRLVLVFGAEGEGMSQVLIDAADERLMIPGSGVVESLNIAASAAVVLGEYWRQTRLTPAI